LWREIRSQARFLYEKLGLRKMKYQNGRVAAVGDRVRLWKNQYGTVVCSIDTKQFTPEHPQEQWEYLGAGIMIQTDDGNLFHYTEPDEDFEFIKSVRVP
jgi:hypothetical protein